MTDDELIEHMIRTLGSAEEHLTSARRQGHTDDLERALDLRAVVLVALDRYAIHRDATLRLIDHLADTIDNVRSFTDCVPDRCAWCVDLEAASTERRFEALQWREGPR
ncbi:MAG: hypothetical protein JWM90_36 [Thermoleophilia bacterium]|nr:hypothetical protein [Thermoleophilia bacterium]